MSLEQFLTRAWYGGAAWVRLLEPLALLYVKVIEQRRRTSRFGQESLPVPLVIVGNITLGGTGKTPLIIHLCRILHDRGIRVGVISRGYGAGRTRFPHAVQASDSPVDVGDEPLLTVQETGLPLVIDPDRLRAARHLLDIEHVELILSDDGMQHYALPRDLEILVVDGVREFGNERCLPAGPLREPVDRLRDVDFCLINGTAQSLTSDALRQSADGDFRLIPKNWIQLSTGERVPTESHVPSFLGLSSGSVRALAAIGNPQRFFAALEDLGIQSECHALDDHHQITAEHLQRIGAGEAGVQVLMTTKDAVKCRSEIKSRGWHNCWALDVGVEIDEGLQNALVGRIEQLVNDRTGAAERAVHARLQK